MKRFTLSLLIIFLFLAGASTVIYPMASNLFYEKNQSHVLEEYDETMEQLAQEELDREHIAYNQQIKLGITEACWKVRHSSLTPLTRSLLWTLRWNLTPVF